MTSVILFVFGTIIGSFLNVLALRHNSGLSLQGRSHCPACGGKLRAYELVPILSFLLQMGRCRRCGARISWQYASVEALTGLVFLTIYNLGLSIPHFLLLATVFSLYIAILIYDIRHKIIPDHLVYLSTVLALILPLFIVHYSLLDWLAGPILALFFASIWFFSQGRAMGFGDAKLVLSLGLLLGAAEGFSAIILSFWLGAAWGLMLVFFSRVYPLSRLGKGITMKSEIPFAPFIIFGAWLSLIFQLNLLHVSI